MSDMTFVVVGCGASKRDEKTEAQDLYTSNYFALKRKYAEAVGDSWMILSAEHGLVQPHSAIEPYDTTIGDLDEGQLDELAMKVGLELIDWIEWYGHGDVDQVIVLAGKSYLEPLRERETFSAGITPPVRFPLQQNNLGGIGEQMAWLKERSTRYEQTTLVTDGGTSARKGESEK